MADISNVKGDQFSVTIAGSDAPFHATIGVGGLIETHKVTSGRSGGNVLAEIVQAVVPVLEFDFIECHLAFLRTLCGQGGAANEAIPVGTVVPEVAVQLHPIGNADATGDLHFYAMSFSNIRETTDGQGERHILATGTGHQNSAGKVWQWGTPA